MKRTSIVTTLAANVLLAAMPALTFAQGLSGSPRFAGTVGSDLISGVTNIINFLLILAGLVAAIYIIYGGVRYIISRGDENEAEAAKNTILFAVIGLIVIGFAAAIVNFVITAIRGS